MASLVIALDCADPEKAINLARKLETVQCWLKVGLELFTSAGPAIVASLKKLGFRIFLDLKFYDIPNTAAGAAAAAAKAGADMLTLHLQGGRRMCEAARNALPASNRPLLAGVTVLTSFTAGEMPGITLAPAQFAAQLAAAASQWGLDALDSSGSEVAAIKAACPGLLAVCPGIRPKGASSQDQRRVMTPAQAVANGADFLVVGRPVASNSDPAAAAARILQEMASA